jgi:hypothetical protein
MKVLVAAVAFAALVASPALAQSYDPDVGTGNIVPQANAANYLRGPLYQGNHRTFAGAPGYRGHVYHWPRYDAQGVDQNAPE